LFIAKAVPSTFFLCESVRWAKAFSDRGPALLKTPTKAAVALENRVGPKRCPHSSAPRGRPSYAKVFFGFLHFLRAMDAGGWDKLAAFLGGCRADKKSL
jgi:hypothetical protein